MIPSKTGTDRSTRHLLHGAWLLAALTTYGCSAGTSDSSDGEPGLGTIEQATVGQSCGADTDCGNGEFCDFNIFPFGQACAACPGPTIPGDLCGIDGNNYGSEIDARCARIETIYGGPCAPPPAGTTTIYFSGMPGPDNILGTLDDMMFGTSSSDALNYGEWGRGARIVDNEYGPLGIQFTGAAALGLIGGGLQPPPSTASDNTTNWVLDNIVITDEVTGTISGVGPMTMRFARSQTQITFDYYGYINVSATSQPVTVRDSTGQVLVSFDLATCAAANGCSRLVSFSGLDGRYQIASSSPFTVVELALPSPSPAGFGIDNVTFQPRDMAWRMGWVWNDQTNPPAGYVPPAAYSYNSAGGTNTVTRNSTGSYRVDFPLLAVPLFGGGNLGNAQVVAYGNGGERCKVESWGGALFSTTLGMNVRCYTAAGTAVDTRFVALFRREVATGSQQGGYLWANDATASSYTPSTNLQWGAPAGMNHTISHTSTGVYQVTIAGTNTLGGTVAVTAYGAGSEHCKVASWARSGSNTLVSVRCFNTTGGTADTRFTLSYGYAALSQNWGNAPFIEMGGYAWANNASAASYTPSSTYQKVSYSAASTCSSLSATAGKTGAAGSGTYFLDFPSLSPTSSASLVTAYGSGSEYCKPTSWLSQAGGTRMSVKCFNGDGSGATADTQFVGQYLRAQAADICN